MTIPFIDLKAQYNRLKPQIQQRIDAVLEHGRFIMGPEVGELESALAEFCGARHAVACSSGTDALLMALMAKGIGPGDAVFCPTFTFTATAEVVLLLGATPVFVDVDARTYNIDVAKLEQRVGEVKAAGALRAAAVMPVDLFGLPADYPAINALAEREGMVVLADSAQGFGGALDGKKVGTLADMTATSFFPAKPLGCYGDGGAVFTDDDGLADAMRSIRAHGKGGAKYDIIRIGLNARLDTLQAAILLPKLAVFAEEVEARETLAAHYDSRLAEVATVPARVPGARSAWAQYTIQVAERDAVAARMKDDGVPSAVYYPLPMHQQSAYAHLAPGDGSLSVSESLPAKVLSLPMHPYMDTATADKVCDAVIRAVKG